MKTAAIYCRVSTENQEREGTSLYTQYEACLAKAKELGCEVPAEHIFREVWTGADLDRPQLMQLRELVRQRLVQYVVCHSTDRLSRNPIHIAIIAEECDKRGVELVFVTEPLDGSPEGQLIRYVKGYAAQMEREKIRERNTRGRRERIKKGKLACGAGSKLYGYDYIRGKESGQGIRAVNQAEAEIVRGIFRWYTEEGLPIHGIARRLTASTVPSPSGKPVWSSGTIFRMLRNPAYCGHTFVFTQSRVEGARHIKPDNERKNKATHIIHKPREQWVALEGATPAIISQEVFDEAQRRLKRNKELAARNTKRDYLLRGYLTCAQCGKRYDGATKRYNTLQGLKEYRYYRCSSNFKVHNPYCANPSCKAEDLESIVWQEIERVLSKPEIVFAELHRQNEKAQSEAWQTELDTVSRLVANRYSQKDRINMAFRLTGDIETFKRDIALVTDDIREFEAEKARLESVIRDQHQRIVDLDNLQKACGRVASNMEALSFQEKRLTLEALAIRVMIDDNRISIHGTIPVTDGQIVFTPSKRKGERMPSILADQLTQVGHRIPLG